MPDRVIVVGGGASGLMAAGMAAENGARVIVMEKMKRPARKLGLTGKGRCNLTNTAPQPEFIEHFGPNGRFLRQAFSRFFSDDLIGFFEKLGVPTEIERGGRVFPKSEKALDVVRALLQWVSDLRVEIRTQSRINHISIKTNRVVGVFDRNTGYEADAVILAAGGSSYPRTGSNGDAYYLARTAGHKLVNMRPALVPLETDGDVAPRLEGLNLRNVEVKIISNGKVRARQFGEMLFTAFGVSGPIILSLSKTVVDLLHDKKTVELSIDLKPALDFDKLNQRLLRDFDQHGRQQLKSILKGLLPLRLIPVYLEKTAVSGEKVGNQINSGERRQLLNWLKDFRLRIRSHRSFDEAIVTAGGVDLRQVNPRTLESKLVKNLFFCGEVLDLDGDTGGYNLQAAFSTGWLAGIAAAEAAKS